jgi:hypothetical protein
MDEGEVEQIHTEYKEKHGAAITVKTFFGSVAAAGVALALTKALGIQSYDNYLLAAPFAITGALKLARGMGY